MAHISRLQVSELPSVQSVQRHVRCLYVIQEQESSYFKIGIAGHPARRLGALQAGNRRRLHIVAAYAGNDADCAYFEKVTLRYFKATAGSEWIYAERLSNITDFLDAFCEASQ